MSQVAVILNAHRERWYLHTALASVADAVARARAEAGLDVAVHIVLDRPDDLTREVAEASRPEGATMEEVDHGDLALSRQSGIAAVTADFVALMDGDDLWGQDWLVRAHEQARRATRPTVWHPDINVIFGGGQPQVFVHADSESPDFDSFELFDHNHWTSLSFAARETYLEFPFHPLHLTRGRGFEDWSWNCRTLAAGVAHRVVPETVHFIRRREGSLSRLSQTLGILPEPTTLFRSAVGCR